MSYKRNKTITVLGPDGTILSRCTQERASTLLLNGRASKVDDTTISITETKQDRKKKMHDIIEESGRICYICGEKIPEDIPATIDHIIPKSRDKYADVYENMRCCCPRCNLDKENKKPLEYIKYILKHRKEHDYLSDDRLNYLARFFMQYEREWEIGKKERNNGSCEL